MQVSAKTEMHSSSVVTASGKSDRSASIDDNHTGRTRIKESNPVIRTNKKKGKNEISSGSGGSLASLWGRTTAKSKTSRPATDAINEVPVTAMMIRLIFTARGSQMEQRQRKRMVVMDLSDEDEDEENVIRLDSPDPSTVQPGSDSLHDNGKLMEKKNSSFEDQKTSILQVKYNESKEINSGLTEDDKRIQSKNDITGISLRKKAQTYQKHLTMEIRKQMIKQLPLPLHPRKVQKTRIDERGREVIEVVWEGEGADGNADKNTSFRDVTNRMQEAVNSPLRLHARSRRGVGRTSWHIEVLYGSVIIMVIGKL